MSMILRGAVAGQHEDNLPQEHAIPCIDLSGRLVSDDACILLWECLVQPLKQSVYMLRYHRCRG
jgi:hypothetical protein